jgi:nicotinamide-nucleotide amidase
VASVEIVAVGTEILLGHMVDTNSAHIARTLADSGIDVYQKHAVGDNAARLEAMLRGALDRADGAITTGGLGPTVDDLTKDAVSAVIGARLELDEPSLLAIEERMRSFGRTGPLAENNRRQAILPAGCVVMPNPHGTAPGFIALRADGKFVACMPGVPSEMKPMLEEHLIPWIVRRYGIGEAIYTRTLHTVGISESLLDTKIESLFRTLENPKIAMLAHSGKVDVKVMAKAPNRAAADALIAPVEADVRARIGPGIFGIDDETLESALVKRLTEARTTLGTAESLTGGSLADAIVRVGGASAIFLGGIVAYDNTVKTALLGVSEETLRAHGAVSEETAREMALGACARLGTDLALSTTGIAGPAGGSAEKPVGLVYVALGTAGGETIVRRLTLPGNREEVRRRATLSALDLLWRYLDGDETATAATSSALGSRGR